MYIKQSAPDPEPDSAPDPASETAMVPAVSAMMEEAKALKVVHVQTALFSNNLE